MAGAAQIAACAKAAPDALVTNAPIAQIALTSQPTDFMAKIMSANRGREKAVILKSVNGDDPDTGRVTAALGADIAERFGPPEARPLSLLAYVDNEFVGGLLGGAHWRWLYIRQLWVDPGWRGRGVGGDLLSRAEADAQANDCVGMYIDTFDPRAVGYYESKGFEVCGRIADFPPGFTRTYLKRLLRDDKGPRS